MSAITDRPVGALPIVYPLWKDCMQKTIVAAQFTWVDQKIIFDCRDIWNKHKIKVIVHVYEMRGTAIWYDNMGIIRLMPFFVDNEGKDVIPTPVADALLCGEIETAIHQILPYPLYESMSAFRMWFGSPRSIADIILEHFGENALQTSHDRYIDHANNLVNSNHAMDTDGISQTTIGRLHV